MVKRKAAPQPEEPPAETARTRQPDKLEQAKAKLQRMLDTNKIAFKFRDDLGRIEDELAKFQYSQAEMEHILEPKGAKGIPGFSYSEIERQKQYVNYLTAHAKKPGGSHAEALEQGRDQDTGQQIS
jgi:hypothetical protein